MKFVYFICLILLVLIQSCFENKEKNISNSHSIDKRTDTLKEQPTINPLDSTVVVMDSIYVDTTGEIDTMNQESKTLNTNNGTKIRLENYSIIFHNIEFDDIYHEGISQKNTVEAVYGIAEEIYTESKIINKDTVHLSEEVEIRINNTLIQIIPIDKNDRFIVSRCYLTNLYEILVERNSTGKEHVYENKKLINEKTKLTLIKDSANYFFRVITQIDYERGLYKEELKRITKKYHLKDTLVIIPGEYDITVNLTKNKKLLGYDYEAYIFRIDRYHNKKLIETKYILIDISTGC